MNSSMEGGDLLHNLSLANELSLRASVGCLVRVLFKNPRDQGNLLALEHIATYREINGNHDVIVTSKPFGGAVKLIDPQALHHVIGDFQYDSERSRLENDFRIMINPGSWNELKSLCWEHFKKPSVAILDTGPERELAEEFEDTLHLNLTRDMYQLKALRMCVEEIPAATNNVRVFGLHTVRIYYLYEAWINSLEIIDRILTGSKQYSDKALRKLALQDSDHGGRGRANATNAVELEKLTEVYRSLSIEERTGKVIYKHRLLDDNVLAILEDVEQHRYLDYVG